jgi:hypothetical protein
VIRNLLQSHHLRVWSRCGQPCHIVRNGAMIGKNNLETLWKKDAVYYLRHSPEICLEPWVKKTGVDSASKNEYQDIPGGKGGRCVRVTTLPPSCAECLVIWSLNRPEPSGPHRPVIGTALPFYLSIDGWTSVRDLILVPEEC